MLSIESFIIIVYCYVHDFFNELNGGQKIRRRGCSPSLTDTEVITMEIVGEYLGIDTDKGIWEYFCRHWSHLFPNIGSRPNFARQSANIWYWKQRLQQKFAKQLGANDDNIYIVDGLPMPVCHFKRAFFSKNFYGEAAYGYCASKGEKYYGFKGHLSINFSGVISGFTLTPANVGEREALWDLVPEISGLLLADKGYIGKNLKVDLASVGVDLQTPFRANMKDKRDPDVVKMFTTVRRRVETVIGQLCDRFNIEKVRAKDTWHLISRTTRKLLSHTVAAFINVIHGREPLQFDGLVAAK